MRRTPEATALSPVTVISPISPVRRTSVPPAQFDRPAECVLALFARALTHEDRTDLVAVSPNSAELQGLAGVIHRHGRCRDLVVFEHDLVRDILDAGEFFRRDRLRMHEIEAQADARRRPALRDVIASCLPQHLHATNASPSGARQIDDRLV